MAHREIRLDPIRTRRALNNALLGGVSLVALMMVSDLGEARSLTPGANTVAPTAAAMQAGIAAAQQGANAPRRGRGRRSRARRRH